MGKTRIELHAHSKLSHSYGIEELSSYIEYALYDNANAMAITDLNTLVSLPNFYEECNYYGDFKPIFGLETLYENDEKEELSGFINEISIIALNKVGLTNMNKILSSALNDSLGIVRTSVINKCRKNILLGYSFLSKNSFMPCDKVLKEIMNDFDYIEVLPPSYYNWENAHEEITRIINLAKELGKIVVAVSNAHFVDSEFVREAYQVLSSTGLKININSHLFKFLSTDEMLKEFNFLTDEESYEIVVTNTNMIAEAVESFSVLPNKLSIPEDDELKGSSLKIGSIRKELVDIVYENLHKIYGENPDEIIMKRLTNELNIIHKYKYDFIFYMAHVITKKARLDNRSFGIRGTVSSSLVANLLNLVDINPLPAHYICPECKYHKFIDSTLIGNDLKNKKCPHCHNKLLKDGYNLYSELLFGTKGDKKPIIDFNFAPDYHKEIIDYCINIFGKENCYHLINFSTTYYNEALTICSQFFEGKLEKEDIEYIAKLLTGVFKKEYVIPHGIVYIPKNISCFDVAPVKKVGEYKALYHEAYTIGDNLFKINLLSHNDYGRLDEMMNHAKKHSPNFKYDNLLDIPLDDKEVYKLFNSVRKMGFNKKTFLYNNSTAGIPDFTNNFTREILDILKPEDFDELVRVSALSHGTNVWVDNGQKLFEGNGSFSKVPLKKLITTREDIFKHLLDSGIERETASDITKYVTFGKAYNNKEHWSDYKELMRAYKISEWFIHSCEQIRYLFSRAQTISYVQLSVRIAWFKLYEPKTFYTVLLKDKKELLELSSSELIDRYLKLDYDNDDILYIELILESRNRGIFLTKEEI